MPNTKPEAEKPATELPALPSLDDIVSVAASDIPDSTPRVTLSDTERALAEKIVGAAANGNVAVGPKIGDRKATRAAAARIRRLVLTFIRLSGTAVSDMPTIGTRIVAKDGAYAWGITLTAPTPAETPEAAGDGDSAGEANADGEASA